MPDKPDHVLEIPASLGRDVDRAREGKAPPPPMEAFFSDQSLQEIANAAKAGAGPVHADRLYPITRGEASRRSRFDGETLPSTSVRRVIPAPFQRPRIVAGSHGKSWQVIPADQVAEGDIVPDVGLVVEAYEHVVHKTLAEVLGFAPGPRSPADPAPIIEKQIDFGDLSELVAVGTVILVRGQGGEVKAFHPDTEVQVFR